MLPYIHARKLLSQDIVHFEYACADCGDSTAFVYLAGLVGAGPDERELDAPETQSTDALYSADAQPLP